MLATLRRLLPARKAAPPAPLGFGSGFDRGWFRILESYAGAWQANVEIRYDSVLAFHAVYACITLISSDISKLRLRLVEIAEGGIWRETTNPAYSPVLRKPNSFQTRIQFVEQWIISKLTRGNSYVLKERDARNVVTALYVLDPNRVRVLVAGDGSVFYELDTDHLAGLEARVIVPAREMIHDRFNCLYHPLVGVSPIYACGLAATQGLAIQNQATRFFTNAARPGGILTAPGAIADDTAERLKKYWDDNFSGANAGRIAVVGDGLKFEQLTVSAEAAQLVEQLKWTPQVVASTFHIPPYKLGLDNQPSASNVQALNLEYYTQALQVLIEALEVCLDEGLGVGERLGTEFDLDGLLRMDTGALVTALKDAVGAGIMAPNEARRRLDLPPVTGGDAPYLQQQNYSLEALAKRDAGEDPFKAATPPAPAPPAEGGDAEAEAELAAEERAAEAVARHLEAHPPAAGRDGIGLAGALIDREGRLVVTLSDGTVRELGVVAGRDGAPGEAGRDGTAGRDALELEDLTADYDGERGLTLRFKRGELERSIPLHLPIVLDRGVWREGLYAKGDGVSFGGSFWIAQSETRAKPGEEAGAWRLAVKRGRDAARGGA